ncbi:hypothetical protein BELL_0337g00060 [Botrytis elliptica]|uniref:Uncharacterized protein n=1 Tax=Botrytis elliptica TaxID=278938 RepID=A0A4Z1JQ53_9HELO|nr:hypothetical protein BELL_0337g00060 [Botrytis elliptica]
MRDDNSITNPLGLPTFNGRSQSQLRLEAPLSFNNSRFGYPRAKRLANIIGIPASQNKIQKTQVTNVKEKTKAKNGQESMLPRS